MKIIENLEFQKKYFQDIFQSYYDNKEIAVTVDDSNIEELKDSKENEIIKDEIIILCDNYNEILKKVFVLPFTIKEQWESGNYEDRDSIYLIDNYLESMKLRGIESNIEINFPIHYNLRFYTLRLTKNIRRSYLNKTTKVIVTKNLDDFEAMLLSNVDHIFLDNDKGIESLGVLLKKLETHHYSKKILRYNLKSDKKTKEFNLSKGRYSLSVSTDLCNRLNKKWEDRNPKKSDYHFIIEFCLDVFKKESIDHFRDILRSGNFSLNFKLIDCYFKEIYNLEKELKNSIFNTFQPDINRLWSEEMDLMDRYIYLMDSSINKVDDILRKSMEKLLMKINEVLREAC